jgi:hypothetical protein
MHESHQTLVPDGRNALRGDAVFSALARSQSRAVRIAAQVRRKAGSARPSDPARKFRLRRFGR